MIERMKIFTYFEIIMRIRVINNLNRTGVLGITQVLIGTIGTTQILSQANPSLGF